MSGADVVVAFHDAGVSGPLRSHERELRWLSDVHEVEILVPAGGRRAQEFSRLGATVTPGPYGTLGMPGSAADLARGAARAWREERWFRTLLRDRRPRLAIAVTSALPAFILAAHRAGVPTIALVAELWLDSGRGRMREAAGRRLLATELRLADSIVACSEAVARQFGDSSKVSTIHPGVEESYAAGSGSAFRLDHEIPKEAPLIACVGNLTRGRGQEVLLRALPALLARRPDLRCVIKGSPFPRRADHDFEVELHQLASELGVEGSVVWTSGSGPVADLYAAADAIVNPATTHPESFGRVAFEAGIAGTPAVCSRTGAIPELHTDGVTALLVPRWDAEALAAAVERLLDDPELGARLAAGAAALARRIADPEQSLAAFQRVVGAQISS
jgi:glycosyltransferase involved in cell wall biosynthesis